MYSKIHDDLDKVTYGNWMEKQLSRLESQRVRLRKELDNDITLQERLQVEKMILDLDSKISSLLIKMDTFKQYKFDVIVAYLNNWMKEHGHKDRFLSQGSLYRIPEKSREKIFELLDDKY